MSLEKMTKLSWIYDLYLLSQSALALEDPSRVAGDLMKHIVSGFDAQSGSLALCDEVLYDRLVIVAAVDLPVHVTGTVARPAVVVAATSVGAVRAPIPTLALPAPLCVQ